MRHFLDLWLFSSLELRWILDESKRRKRERRGYLRGVADKDAPLSGYVLALVFEKPSTRTRVSFQMSMRQLGGESLVLNASEIQLGRGESIEDTARVLGSMVDGVMVRCNRHEDLLCWSESSSVPVINGLTDCSHPCQILACLQSLEERGLDLRGARLAWVGDGNNVCASFVHAASKFGYSLSIASPEGYALPEVEMSKQRSGEGFVSMYGTAREAVRGADAVITDTHISMGDEAGSERLQALQPFRVDELLMEYAVPGALFSHCLPAHRGQEVTSGVIDGESSLVFEEAENRLHVQKAILCWCFEVSGRAE